MLETSTTAVADLRPYYQNPRQGDVGLIAESLKVNGQYRHVVVNRGTHTGRENEILAGNHTWLAAQRLGMDHIEVSWVDVDNDQAARIVAVDNKASDEATYDNDALASLLEGLPDLEGTGFTDQDLQRLLGNDTGGGGGVGASGITLAERFGVPPMTVLSARGGEWKERKKAWMALGIQSEIGRTTGLVYDQPQSHYSNWYEVKNDAEADLGRVISAEDLIRDYGPKLRSPSMGTSVFDPALTELLYRWHSAPSQRVIDPWAGGSVRGIVAGVMGRDYVGIELRPEQVEANRAQLDLIGKADAYEHIPSIAPVWVTGESTEELRKLDAETFDMAIGCPPYYDLEVYSDDARDLSTMSHADFEAAMAVNVAEVGRVLKPDSFAVFVVGAVRDKRGAILDMRRLMSTTAEAAGMYLYNDAILLTPVGNAAVRAGRAFSQTRVLSRVHQEVLVYVKGDRKRAATRAGLVDVTADIEQLAEDLDEED